MYCVQSDFLDKKNPTLTLKTYGQMLRLSAQKQKVNKSENCCTVPDNNG